jgi:ElaB/YqjD/DUF883 family membrane-anchored ribosome-binding protein
MSEAETLGTDLRSDQDGQNSQQMQDRAQEMAGKTREAASEYGQKAKEQADKGREQAAGGMERAAEQLRERSGSTQGIPAQAGVKVADGMETAATYLREHKTDDMINDLEHYVKEHPTQALAGAIFTGFVIGRVLR